MTNENNNPDESVEYTILESNIAEIGETINNEPEPEPIPAPDPIIQPDEKLQDEINTTTINNPVNIVKGKRGRPKKTNGKTKRKVKADNIKIENTSVNLPENVNNIPAEKSDVDSLIMLLNGTLIPIGSKMFNKKADECQITDAQMSEIIKLRPESDILGKSWLAYFGAIVGTAAANFVRANQDDKILTVIHAVKNMTPEQRIEVRNLLIGSGNNE